MEPTRQDLIRQHLEQTESVLTELQTGLATVMGPAEAGSLDQQQLSEQLQELGPPPSRSASAANKQEYMDKLAAAMQHIVQAQTQQAYHTATEKAKQAVTCNVQKIRESVT
jgi:hypothetical protein